MRSHRRQSKPGMWLMTGGLLLLAAAILLTGYNLWDECRAGAAASQVLEHMPEAAEFPESFVASKEQEIPDYILNPDMEMPVVEIDGNDYIGTLDIPSLDLSLPVMSEWSYPKLRIAPCRYAGTAYKSGFVISAHNYRTHFRPLSQIMAGDRVVFTDADGNVFLYQVEETQILEPTAIDDMLSEDWDLSLFTCTPGGTARLAVRCSAAQESFAWAE